MKSIKNIVSSDLCIGCGFCIIDPHIKNLVFSKKKGQSIPEIKRPGMSTLLADKICPGPGYPIIKMSEKYFASEASYDIELGFVYDAVATHVKDEKILRNASSGGIMTEIPIFLLKEGIVDKVVVTKFITTKNGIKTKTILTNNYKEIIKSQGSKYCPVDMSQLIYHLMDLRESIAFIGTPCHVAALRQMEAIIPDLRRRVKFVISNFCGGIHSYNSILSIAETQNIDVKKISSFRFRGGGQPGSLEFGLNSEKSIRIPYPKYWGYTGFTKHYRCHCCIDATGELADISCGDAWLPRLENDKFPWSIVIFRNKKSREMFQSMLEKRLVETMHISKNEIVQSQIINIRSKKYRHKSRMAFYKLLKKKVPHYDGGFLENKVDIITEIQVFLKHKFKYFLEKTKLYYKIYKKVKKI